LTIGGATRLVGLLGDPVEHSLSPLMQNAAFAAVALDWAYVPLRVTREALEGAVAGLAALGFAGANVTIPHKTAVVGYCDELDEVAARAGSVNTLVVRDGRWIGANTDVDGFLTPLIGRMALKGTRATVLGAGGAARAVVVALCSQGASVTVCARRPEAAKEVAALACGSVGTWPPKPGSWDVLVNATSSGSGGPADDPMDGVRLDGEIVFDLVYAPARTPLLERAAREGCMTIGGLEMLVAQAERQFELWTGCRPPSGLFKSAAATAIGESHETAVRGHA